MTTVEFPHVILGATACFRETSEVSIVYMTCALRLKKRYFSATKTKMALQLLVHFLKLITDVRKSHLGYLSIQLLAHFVIRWTNAPKLGNPLTEYYRTTPPEAPSNVLG
jgi:hypothetical protein